MSSESSERLVLNERPITREDVGLWFGVLGGPIFFFLDFLASYLLVSVVEAKPSTVRDLLLHLFTVVALVLTIVSGVVPWRIWKRYRDAEEEPGARVRFMAMAGVVTAAFFVLAIVANAIPKWILKLGQ